MNKCFSYILIYIISCVLSCWAVFTCVFHVPHSKSWSSCCGRHGWGCNTLFQPSSLGQTWRAIHITAEKRSGFETPYEGPTPFWVETFGDTPLSTDHYRLGRGSSTFLCLWGNACNGPVCKSGHGMCIEGVEICLNICFPMTYMKTALARSCAKKAFDYSDRAIFQTVSST